MRRAVRGIVWGRRTPVGCHHYFQRPFAKFERGLISERTRASLAAARKRGRTLGRPLKLTRHQLIHARQLIDNGMETRSAVAALFNVDEKTLRRSLTRCLEE
jgi:DNA invertase Pin-like site-specific DNA recombinase